MSNKIPSFRVIYSPVYCDMVIALVRDYSFFPLKWYYQMLKGRLSSFIMVGIPWEYLFICQPITCNCDHLFLFHLLTVVV